RAVNSVASGLGAHINEWIARSFGAASEDPVPRNDPDVHDVDEDVGVVTGMKRRLAAQSRYADAVAVSRNAPHDAVDQMFHARRGEVAEPQRVQRSDRPRSHREDVSQDPADARRRTLVRLDEGGMVVRLHFECDGEAVSDVDDARVLSRPLNDARSRGREPLQMDPRGLVGAVLAPHGRENAELDQTRLAAENLQDPLILLLRGVVLGDELWRDRHAAGADRI